MSRRLALVLLLLGCGQRAPAQRACRPLPSAWAISVHVTDATSGRPVTNAVTDNMSSVAETDSLGWLCMRGLVQNAETLSFRRPGYRDASLVFSGARGQVVTRELRFVRVARPCCDLRGQWNITLQLDSLGDRQPQPKARVVSGALNLGPRYLPAQANDDLDSLVRVVRGLHQVDFTPFFGGPVARDLSTSIFGEGPDLFHEVQASIPAGDSVDITFIPRMSHGSLWLHGRIRADTIRGMWWQAMFGRGARGRFVMTRTGSADTASVPGPPARRDSGYHRTLRVGPPAVTVAAGHVPHGTWRPELAVAPSGRLWLASGGLFVADSFGGSWRRVFGGEADPVESDELRIGVRMAFVGDGTAIVGLSERFLLEGAPVMYRTDDGGATWSAVTLDSVVQIDAVRALGQSLWLAATTSERKAAALFSSADGGKTWRAMAVPDALRNVNVMYRVSPSTAFLATLGHNGRPALWRTTDAGGHWLPLATPSDQGLLRLGPSDSRVEQIATIGSSVLVTEHGRVFASSTDPIRWRALEGIEAIASEPEGDRVFVLVDSLRPALLDKNLRIGWRSDRLLELQKGSYLEQVAFHGGIGYVTEGYGSIHQIRNKTLRVLRPLSDGRESKGNVNVIIEKP